MNNIRGRFNKAAAESVLAYTASVQYDWMLYPYDIAGSIAHTRMLGKQGIIKPAESKKIISALQQIQAEISSGKFVFNPELEDIHMNIEARLVEKIGDTGKKLHTARSRNDQVALDVRLFVRDAIAHSIVGMRHLQQAIVDVATAHKDVVLPGYTHVQRAQPVLLAHHLLAYFEMLERDIARFEDVFTRADVLPLGSGALAGVAYNIDRESVAKELGFSTVSKNSIDAVSDRDFILEYQAAAAIFMMHISRMAEELVYWSSAEFDFIELDDAYATGSSIMPQKKNPDVAELARGKTGRVYGNLMSLLTTMKGLPLAYNRDMQEDKEQVFDTVKTIFGTLEVFPGMLSTMKIKTASMKKAAEKGYLLATDIADYLVKNGESFRAAHEITGKLVNYAVGKGKSLDALKLAEYKKFSPKFKQDVLKISVESSLAARDNTGGTARVQVKKQLAAAAVKVKKALAEVR
ncbi:MAG TPA: argininosuccinate lyase [Dehalococcoidales bacterium]|nr:argininosuccinate lyase [Dehalococcoidales bacterium]